MENWREGIQRKDKRVKDKSIKTIETGDWKENTEDNWKLNLIVWEVGGEAGGGTETHTVFVCGYVGACIMTHFFRHP